MKKGFILLIFFTLFLAFSFSSVMVLAAPCGGICTGSEPFCFIDPFDSSRLMVCGCRQDGSNMQIGNPIGEDKDGDGYFFVDYGYRGLLLNPGCANFSVDCDDYSLDDPDWCPGKPGSTAVCNSSNLSMMGYGNLGYMGGGGCAVCKWNQISFCGDKDGDGYYGERKDLCWSDDPYFDPRYTEANCLLPGGDCEDENSAVNPGATEICTGGDENCNTLSNCQEYWICPPVNTPSATGGVQCDFLASGILKSCCNEQCTQLITIFKDDDGDGEGDYSKAYRACPVRDLAIYPGYVANAYDCDDSDPTICSERCGLAYFWDPPWKLPGAGNECKKCGIVFDVDPFDSSLRIERGKPIFYNWNPISYKNCYWCNPSTEALEFIDPILHFGLGNPQGDGDCFYCDFTTNTPRLDPSIIPNPVAIFPISDSNKRAGGSGTNGAVDCKICEWRSGGGYQQFKPHEVQASLTKIEDAEDTANGLDPCTKCNSGSLDKDETDSQVSAPWPNPKFACKKCSGGNIVAYDSDPRINDNNIDTACLDCVLGQLVKEHDNWISGYPSSSPDPAKKCCNGGVYTEGPQCCVSSSIVTRSCAGKTCGDDGCGGSCGTCNLHESCVSVVVDKVVSSSCVPIITSSCTHSPCSGTTSGSSYFMVVDLSDSIYSSIAYKLSPSGINFNIPLEASLEYSEDDFLNKNPSLIKISDEFINASGFGVDILGQDTTNAGLDEGTLELDGARFIIPRGSLDKNIKFTLKKVNITQNREDSLSGELTSREIIGQLISWVIGQNKYDIRNLFTRIRVFIWQL